MFLAIQDLLNEYDNEFESINESINDTDYENPQANQARAAAIHEPNIIDLSFNDYGILTLETINIERVTFKYYLVNVELLFSKSPFLAANTEHVSYI